MEEKKPKLWKSALYWGVILAIVSIIYNLVLYFLDLSLEKWASWVSLLFFIPILVIATKSYRDSDLGGVMTYGQSLGFGVLVVLFSSLIYAVYYFVFLSYVDPGMIDKMVIMQEEEMLKQGVPEEQIEQAMGMVKKFMTPLIINIFAIPFSVFFGFIICLLTSIFLKKKPAEIPFES